MFIYMYIVFANADTNPGATIRTTECPIIYTIAPLVAIVDRKTN